jgi:hypothetical protein
MLLRHRARRAPVVCPRGWHLRARADWCDLRGFGVSLGETGTGSVIIGVLYAL